jgi:SAM-dependent methyltransferase
MQTVDWRHFPLQPGQRLLDLGCGEGRHAIAAQVHEGADVLALDLSLADLRAARERQAPFADARPDALFAAVNASGLALPLADHSVDAVVCSEVLEHIEDYAAVLAEIRRVLRPGGQLCVSVPRAWPERICWWLSRAYHEVPGGHIRIFRRRELQSQVEALGFRCYRRHGAHALHAPYWWLQCLFWRGRDSNPLVRLYHRFLVWDLLRAPRLTRWMEALLNPWMGKSVVLYFHSEGVA